MIGKRVDIIGKCERGMKKAVIEIRLVDEAQTESNETIEEEIRNEISRSIILIPWCKEIERVKITES
ncbi:MAG: hypothetical protein ACE5OW_04440 [Candidatus Bathyarchaeia archaeon]